MEKPNAISQTDDFEFDALQEAQNYRAALMSEFGPFLKGDVLEIGAGIGQFSSVIRSFAGVQNLLSVEPEARFCEMFRVAHPDLALVQGTIQDVEGGSSWDAILSVNVLEHIREDQTELSLYHQRLAKNQGSLCLFVPARPEIYAPIDQDFGHFRRYTKPQLAEMMRQAGFKIITLSYYNCVGYLAWWLTFCLRKKRSFDVSSVRLYDRMIFPLVHLFEARVCRPPVGQSLIVVAQAVSPSA